MANDPGSSGTGRAELERMAHYREQAQSAENETVPGPATIWLDMARQYEWLAVIQHQREDNRANAAFGGAPLARSLRVALRNATVDL